MSYTCSDCQKNYQYEATHVFRCESCLDTHGGKMQERARIVAWLREAGDVRFKDMKSGDWTAQVLAKYIERGEHEVKR